MFSFLTSYLPPLSSLPLPSLPQNLQPRLLSFLLRRAVGSFVKGGLNPSQDGDQVKADLAKGTISVNNLELDPNAITPLFVGLPIQFVSGQLGLVKAQVDWPLSFSSGLKVEVDSLNINLKLKSSSPTSPNLSRSARNPPQNTDDASLDPISAAASEFVHDELDAFEDAELRASLIMDASTSDMGASFRLPGAFGGAAFSPAGGDESPQDAGQEVTLLASLLAGLLARLKVEVTRVNVRLLLPTGEDGEGEAEVELVIDSVKYADEPIGTNADVEGLRNKTVRISPPHVRLRLPTPPPRPSSPAPSDSDAGGRSTRCPSVSSSRCSSESIPTIPSILDLSASATNLPPPTPPSPSPPPASQPPLPRRYDSDSSDESDIGPEHDMMMSQSIADMRSSFVSAQSGGESMYASVLGGTMAASRMDAIGETESEEEDSPFVDPEAGSPPPPLPATSPDLGDVSDPPSPRIEPVSAPETEVAGVPSDDGFRVFLSFGHDDLVLILSTGAPAEPAQPHSPSAPALSRTDSATSRPDVAPPLSFSLSRSNSPVVRTVPLASDPFAHSPDHSPISSSSFAAEPDESKLPGRKPGAPPLHVSAILAGPVSALLLPAQLAALLRIGAAFSASSGGPATTAPPPLGPKSASAGSGVSFSVMLKAVHVVVGLATGADPMSAEQVASFFAHPATSHVPLPHLRVRLEGVAAITRPGGELDGSLRAYAVTESLFDGSTRPVLVSDVNVARQYDLDEAFPAFEAADWVGDKAFEARGWRTRPGHLGKLRRVVKEADRLAVKIELSPTKRSVNLGPVHVFADLTILHRVQPLADFLAPIAAAFATAPPPAPVTRPRTPRPFIPAAGGIKRPPPPPTPPLQAGCELVRISVRVPSPAGYQAAIRSGIVKIDVHALGVHLGPSGHWIETQRVGAFFLAPQAGQAVGFLGLTPLARLPHSPPSIRLPSPTSSTTAVQLPLLQVRLTKPIFDGLQLFADDLGQWSAARAAGSPTPTEIERGPRGGDGRILGSAYFGASRQRGGSESSDDLSRTAGSLTGGKTVEVRLSELMVDLLVDEKAKADARVVRRMRARGTDLQVQAHMGVREEGDLLVELEIGDVGFEDATDGRPVQRVLERTSPGLVHPAPAPIVALAFSASVDQDTGLKESKMQLTFAGFTYFLTSDLAWLQDLAAFAKAPAGAFETVVPNELTRIRLRLVDVSVHVTPRQLESRLVVSIEEAKLATNLMPDLPRTRTFVEVTGLRALAIDSAADLVAHPAVGAKGGVGYWKVQGFVQLVELSKCAVEARQGNGAVLPDFELEVLESKLSLSLCADSLASVTALIADLAPPKPPVDHEASEGARPTQRLPIQRSSADLLASVDGAAFAQARAVPEAPEDLDDDVPTNLDYLAEALQQGSTSPGAAGPDRKSPGDRAGVVISDVEGETIRMLDPKGIHILDDYLADPRVDPAQEAEQNPVSVTRCRLARCDVTIHIHEGYDWATTRSAIAAEAKAVRRRLEKIKQLLADGQTPDASAEQASVLLFGSVALGLPPGASELPGPQLLAAINDELERDEAEVETVVGTDIPDDTTSVAESWQTLPAQARNSLAPSRPAASTKRGATSAKARRRLTRARSSAIEVVLNGIAASFDAFPPESERSSRLKVAVATFEILDHVRTSTWRKFLTELRASDGGVVRASGAPMVRLELDKVWPAHRTADAQEELVIKLKIFPLRLYIDQDALDFLKAFAAFKVPAGDGSSTAPPGGAAPAATPSQEPFFQRVEILPVKIKLDYKPKRVDYHALRKGKTAELMNFFHFDGSEITLRHLVVTGISGGTRLSELVQDIWTPDVTSHQLADVLSGIAPVKSVVNVGSGVANLVLLPIEQYRKDGRVVRGLQKGAHAFARQTTMEALSVGARLATGTQGLLEQAEGLLAGRPSAAAPAGTGAVPDSELGALSLEDSVELSEEERRDLVSRYAEQPASLRGGLEEAYKSLGTNFREAAQTILAVPMEVYERSGTEGPVRAVVRAVPVAVLRPMIGGAGAVGKALFGLRNSLDPEGRVEAEMKYKPRGGG